MPPAEQDRNHGDFHAIDQVRIEQAPKEVAAAEEPDVLARRAASSRRLRRARLAPMTVTFG